MGATKPLSSIFCGGELVLCILENLSELGGEKFCWCDVNPLLFVQDITNACLYFFRKKSTAGIRFFGVILFSER